MTGARGIVIAVMVAAILLVPGVLFISDFTRGSTYNATLGDNASQDAQTKASLAALTNKMNESFSLSATMRNQLNDTSITQADALNFNALNFGIGSLFGLGILTFNILFGLPDLILNMAYIILTILPFNLGYLVLGLAGIVGFILVATAIELFTRVKI
jgi:hypothetical protein